MNAREAILQRARACGWEAVVSDEDGEIWARGEERLVVRYRLYGAATNPLMRHYGRPQLDGINWGVETAFFGDEAVVGRNKKGQILRRLR